MGFSTGRDLHLDRNLTNVAMNYRPTGMIADMIAPIVPVQKESDTYPIFSRDEAFAIENTLRARGTEAKRITRSVSSAGYIVKNYALAYDVYLEDRANADPEYATELYEGATRYLVDKLMLDYEARVISAISSATNVGTVAVPNSSWAAAGANAGDPVSQIITGIETIQGRVGLRPNSILFGWRAWRNFSRNYHVRNLVNGVNNGKGFVTRNQAREIFEVERLLVSEAFWHTTNEGQLLSNPNSQQPLSSPFHDRVLVYFAPQAPSRDNPSFMYSFRWTNPALPAPMAVERHPYDSRKKVEGVEAGYWQTENVTGREYSFEIAGVGSAQSNGIA